jgi:hypothetical protein
MLYMATALFTLALGSWNLTFNEADARLELMHAAGSVHISGTLGFSAGEKQWRVVASRDAIHTRLALLDDRGDVQGYLAFVDNGDRLELLVYHRTAQNYRGELRLVGDVAFTPESFACRTEPLTTSRVLQLASGPADSALNNALFDPQLDRALLISAPQRRLVTKGAGVYNLSLCARIEEASEAVWAFTVERDYYRHRYMPYYRPLDQTRCPSAPTGWMSWNTYFDKATAADNLAEARIGQMQLQPFGMEFWSIESWQDNSDQLPVSAFDNLSLTPSPRKFPEGMKKLADDIRALGFRPGIWTAPFGTGSDTFYAAHKAWFLHDEQGKPISTWNGKYTIDPSQQEVIDHLREIHRVMSQEWGYAFFKIDGMSGRNRGYCAHFFERPEIRARFKDPACPNPFERCVKAFREGIGPDRVFLACQGHFTGAEVAMADAARTGADIVHPNQPPHWPNLLNQATCTLNQIFAHNIVFYSDPDTLLVGDFLGIEQARLSTTVVALPGQMMFSGDKLAGLAPERMRLLQQTLPVCNVRPLDLYPVFRLLPVWNLKIARPFATWDVVALFNWEETRAQKGFDFAELGLDPEAGYAVYEFWTGTSHGVRSGRFELEVPGHGTRLLAVHRATPHPQFLSSDRHITQGGVELKALAWDAASKTLAGTVVAVKGFPLTLRFRVPPGYTFDAARTEGGAACRATLETPELLAVTLTAPATGPVPFVVAWK